MSTVSPGATLPPIIVELLGHTITAISKPKITVISTASQFKTPYQSTKSFRPTTKSNKNSKNTTSVTASLSREISSKLSSTTPSRNTPSNLAKAVATLTIASPALQPPMKLSTLLVSKKSSTIKRGDTNAQDIFPAPDKSVPSQSDGIFDVEILN